MAATGVFGLTRFTGLAAGDVLPAVDISDSTQNAHGSLDAITVTNFFGSIPVPVVVTSASANALAVGLTGNTNSAFKVDASTALQVAGLKVVGAVTTGTVAIVVTDSGAVNTNLSINALGAGTIGIGSVSTGRVTITPVTTITGSLTLSAALVYGGVTLSNAVTGTGNMVLSASPTFTGTITGAIVNWSGLATFNSGATIASGQTLTVTGATITGLTAASVGAGTFPSGAFVFAGAVSGITTLAGTGAVSGFTGATFDNGSSQTILTLGNSTNGFGTIRALAGSTHYAWQFGANININQAFEITPSTAVGGTTFSTPALSILGSTGVVTLGQGLTVSAGTTAVQALTAASYSTFAAGYAVTGAVGSAAASRIGMDWSGGAGHVDTFGVDTSTNGIGAIRSLRADGSNAVSVMSWLGTGAVTFAAGISCTTGTFSTSAKTASGSTSVNSASATTLFTIGGAGVFIVYATYSAGNTVCATLVYDGTNWGSACSTNTGSMSAFTLTGTSVQAVQTSGSTQTVTWSYVRVN